MVLLCSNFIFDNPGSYNRSMVLYGAFWYIISCIGFVLTFSEELDYYFVFDDLFMVATSFSLFYSWQSFNIRPPDELPVKEEVIEVPCSGSKNGVQKIKIGPKIIMKQTIGLREVPMVIQDFMYRIRDLAREQRINWYSVTKSFVSKTELGTSVSKNEGANHNMDEKKQVMRKKKRVKRQFKNKRDMIEAAEKKLERDGDI